MQLFYNPNISKEQPQITFDKNESRHIVKVLRKKEGDTVFITDGKGMLFHCEILLANDKKCLVEIKKVAEKVPLRDYYLHLAIAPTKLNDRFEWFLEKATEIGIDEITPVICENSERKVLKLERMEKIIHSASKQSLNFHFPVLNPAISFKEFMQQPLKGQGFIAHCEDTEKQAVSSVWKPQQYTTFLIGPEGDFSPNEIEKSVSKGFQPVSLGNSRLRTETAGIVAVHTIRFLNEEV